LFPVIQASRTCLEVVSPYFIPGRKGAALLADLVARGVDVLVLTNSLAATDVATVHGAYANYRKRLIRSGVQLFELQPFARKPNISVFGSKGASLHTKAFTVDGKVGFVGSFNFDPRSVSLNAEMGVLFEDERLVAQLRERFQRERSPQASYQVTLRKGRLQWTGVDDGEMRHYTSEPEASLSRRLLAALVRFLPIESQL
jgi:putative cardiolipin synthase